MRNPAMLTDLVVAANDWPKALIGKPGVYVAGSTAEIMTLVENIAAAPKPSRTAKVGLAVGPGFDAAPSRVPRDDRFEVLEEYLPDVLGRHVLVVDDTWETKRAVRCGVVPGDRKSLSINT